MSEKQHSQQGQPYTTLRADILRMITGGQRAKREILRVLGNRLIGAPTVLAVLAAMQKDHLIVAGRGNVFVVTNAGRALMPRAQTAFTRGEYRPARIELPRAGSLDHLRLPSMAAGSLHAYRPHA